MLMGLMFLFLSSFGKRSAGSLRRGCECIVLEPSEMIVVSPNFYILYTATPPPDAPHNVNEAQYKPHLIKDVVKNRKHTGSTCGTYTCQSFLAWKLIEANMHHLIFITCDLGKPVMFLLLISVSPPLTFHHRPESQL